MNIFLTALDDTPDPRADNARHNLGELLVVAFVSVLCGATSCAEMAAFGRAKESIFRHFLKLKHAVPSHDTFSAVFRIVDPKALDGAFGRVPADAAALLQEGEVVAIDGKALRGARDRRESAGMRMVVSAYVSRLHLTLASVPADRGAELDAALEVLGLIALKGKVVTADALHCNRRTVAAINAKGGRLVPGAEGQPGVAPVRCPSLLRHAARRSSRGPQRGYRPWPQGSPHRHGRLRQRTDGAS